MTNEEQKNREIWNDYVKTTTNTTFDLSTKYCVLLLHFLSKTNKKVSVNVKVRRVRVTIVSWKGNKYDVF